jgi:hypothetical protein
MIPQSVQSRLHTHNDLQRKYTPQPEILTKALDAAAGRGYAVLPLSGKVPAIPKREGGNGHKDATTAPAGILKLWDRATRRITGYGIATGQRSGVVVAEIDGPAGVAEAKRRGLTSDYIVKSGRDDGDGWHLYLSVEDGVEVKTRDIAPGLRLQGEGAYVVGPGSLHPSGRSYELVRDGEPSPAPEWILAKPSRRTSSTTGSGAGETISVEVAGPPIVESAPGRNLTLTRIAGRLHDGSRDLAQLTRDLEAVNEARCQPPLARDEVEKIARSIHGRDPCNPTPEPTAWVKGAIEYLRGVERPIKGMAASTGWAVYNGLLDEASRYGEEHEQGIALNIDMRTAGQLAGTNASTANRWIRASDLVSVLRRGKGRRRSRVVLHVPPREGHYLQHSSTWGGSKNPHRGRSVASSALQRTIYRLRWSGGSSKARRGVVRGTSRVRQGVVPGRESIRRIGKSKAAILNAVVDCAGEISLGDLADALGRKKRSMRAPLKWLIDAGLLVRPRRGYYDVPEDFERRLSDARGLAREPEADRLQIQRDARQRNAYRNRGSGATPESKPTKEGLENVRRSRRRREQHFRDEAARKERERASRSQISEQEREQRRRVERLVGEGMKRRFAEEEVYGSAISYASRGDPPSGLPDESGARKIPAKVDGVYVHGGECECDW